MEGYFWWLVEKVDPDKKRENYISLLKELFQISYRYSNQMDKNRYEAGVNLRSNFEYNTGFFLGEELNRKPCTYWIIRPNGRSGWIFSGEMVLGNDS